MYLQKQSFLVTFYGLGCFNITEVKAWEVIECFRILTFSQCAGAYKTYGKCHIFKCLLLNSAKGIFNIVCKGNVDLWISGVEVEADWADCRSKSEDHHGNHHHHWDKRTRRPLRQDDKAEMILAPAPDMKKAWSLSDCCASSRATPAVCLSDTSFTSGHQSVTNVILNQSLKRGWEIWFTRFFNWPPPPLRSG